jgi:hypothetical protein
MASWFYLVISVPTLEPGYGINMSLKLDRGNSGPALTFETLRAAHGATVRISYCNCLSPA